MVDAPHTIALSIPPLAVLIDRIAPKSHPSPFETTGPEIHFQEAQRVVRGDGANPRALGRRP
eukprot:2442818-Lingulodinium_polyedra.AAC.1